jgi:hypothetical protein
MTRFKVQVSRKTPLYIIIDAETAEEAQEAALGEWMENGDQQFSELEPSDEIEVDEVEEINDHSLVVAIQEILSGKVWTPDSLQQVANVLQDAGYVLEEPQNDAAVQTQETA